MSKPVAQVAVIGLGAWGTALALHCARQGHHVVAWHRDPGFVKSVTERGELPHASGTSPIPANLKITATLSECESARFAIVALPARAWGEVLPKVNLDVAVSATKGLEPSSRKTPLTYLETERGYRSAQLAVISGPSFASDLIAARPLSLVAASQNQSTAQSIAELLGCSSLRMYMSNDPLGVELGGILKNVIAIAVGVSDALGFGPSARAALISRGLAEMMRLASKLGALNTTLVGLSGLGDLVMTATEDQSRNRTIGLKLGKGESLESIVNSLDSTAEGIATAPLIQELARNLEVDVPITDHVVALIRGTMTQSQVVTGLMTRPRKNEF